MASGLNVAAQPPPGHVHLILHEQRSFYLEIPLRIVTRICRYPPKYLRYLGWCVLGAEGSLQNAQGHEVDLDGNLADRGVYHYRLSPTQQDILSRAINPEVIAIHTQVLSQTTVSRDGFRDELALRDGLQCVWSGIEFCAGVHIIPWSKGDEWLRVVVGNRPHGDERNLDTLRSVNDIRNGFMGNPTLHIAFDSRLFVILKTPNHILQMDDVPERHARTPSEGHSYPVCSRYTLQWIIDDKPNLLRIFPNNSDAEFISSSQKLRPSQLLLDYNYGAAAVKHWGRNYTALQDCDGIPRPQAPEPVSRGPPRTVGDRTITTNKLERARAKDIQQQHANDRGSAEAIDSEKRVWDEDDVMLFFWSNSKAARERRAKKDQEHNDFINKWRSEATM